MGVIVSYFQPQSQGRTDDPDPKTGLTSRERILVRKSFEKWKTDSLKYGIEVFLSLFKKKPEYQNLFPFKDIPYDDLPNQKRFQAHCSSVMYSICSIIDNLEDPDLLIEILKKQGVAHKPRGVPKEAYGVLCEVLTELVEKDFNQETIEAWKKTLKVAFSVIVDAAQYI